MKNEQCLSHTEELVSHPYEIDILSPTYDIATALCHTGELVSPPYEITIVATSYGWVTKSSVWDTMMLKKYGVALLCRRKQVRRIDRGRWLCSKNTSYWIPKVTHVACDISNAQCNSCLYMTYNICDMNTDKNDKLPQTPSISSAFQRHHSSVQWHKSPRKRFV